MGGDSISKGELGARGTLHGFIINCKDGGDNSVVLYKASVCAHKQKGS